MQDVVELSNRVPHDDWEISVLLQVEVKHTDDRQCMQLGLSLGDYLIRVLGHALADCLNCDLELGFCMHWDVSNHHHCSSNSDLGQHWIYRSSHVESSSDLPREFDLAIIDLSFLIS